MSFEEPNDPRSSEIVNNQIELTKYEEQAPGLLMSLDDFVWAVYWYLSH